MKNEESEAGEEWEEWYEKTTYKVRGPLEVQFSCIGTI